MCGSGGNTMVKAVGYYRAASPEGAEMGLQRQKEVVRAYAEKYGAV